MSVLTVLRLLVELDGPWLVGDPDGIGDVHTIPLRELDDTLQVPATSLAGSLRDNLRRQGTVDVAAWMGEARREDDDNSGGPSRLRVLGVRLTGGDRAVARTTTAVDPVAASARRQMLRRVEYVDAKTTLAVYLLHDGEPDKGLLGALAAWRPMVGRRRTNGWGRASVAEIRHRRVDLRERDQLVEWLSGGGPEHVDRLVARTEATAGVPAAEPEDLLRVSFTLPAGVHIGSGELTRDEADGADGEGGRMPVAEIVARAGTPYVPASSWRGVLRSYAGFVLRSLDCPEKTVEWAVGNVFGDANRRSLLTFHDAAVRAAGDEVTASKRRDHVGIDRITGGARANLLFAERVAVGEVELRVSAEDPAAVPAWARALLGHAVRDLRAGFLAIGGRATRGLGTLVSAAESVVPAEDGIDIAALVAAAPKESG